MHEVPMTDCPREIERGSADFSADTGGFYTLLLADNDVDLLKPCRCNELAVTTGSVPNGCVLSVSQNVPCPQGKPALGFPAVRHQGPYEFR